MNTQIMIEELQRVLSLCRRVQTALGVAHMMAESSREDKALRRLRRAGEIVGSVQELLEELENAA